MQRRTFLRSSAASAAAFGVFRRFPSPSPAGAPDLVAAGVMPGATSGTALGVPPNDAKFVALRDRYFINHLRFNPVTSTYLGGDGYSADLLPMNGQLHDYSAGGIERELGFYTDAQKQLAAIDPATLSTKSQTDYHVVESQLAFLLRQIGERRYYQRAVDTYVAEPFRGVDWQLQQMTPGKGKQLGTSEEWMLVMTRVAAIPEYLGVVSKNLRDGKKAGNVPDKRMVRRDGIDGAKANAEYFAKTLPALAREYTAGRPFAPGLLEGLTEAGAMAAQAWHQFASFLSATYDVNESTDRFAVGEEEYAWRVKHVLRDPRTPAELYEYGAAQVALYTDRMVDVARTVAEQAKLGLAFGTPAERAAGVRRVMDYLSTDAPKSDDELFRWYRETGARAVAYGREHRLFDVPANYRLDIVATPPVLRSTIDAAYYPAPPFKKTGVGRFYLTPTGNDAAALKMQNRASVADTAVHEGFPGHDWDYKYMSQHASEISNVRWLTPGAVEDSSSMWGDSMASEGWALYAEELMADPVAGRPYGFYDAGEYLYELQGQLLRAVRVRVDVGIHTGRMSFDEAVDYYSEHVDFIPGVRAAASSNAAARASAEGAERAIYRYSKWPTQAITYNLGKNAIVALREAVRAKEGAAFSARAFHERLMRMGTIPASYFAEAFPVKA